LLSRTCRLVGDLHERRDLPIESMSVASSRMCPRDELDTSTMTGAGRLTNVCHQGASHTKEIQVTPPAGLQRDRAAHDSFA
jgi:hypothetical protein